MKKVQERASGNETYENKHMITNRENAYEKRIGERVVNQQQIIKQKTQEKHRKKT